MGSKTSVKPDNEDNIKISKNLKTEVNSHEIEKKSEIEVDIKSINEVFFIYRQKYK